MYNDKCIVTDVNCIPKYFVKLPCTVVCHVTNECDYWLDKKKYILFLCRNVFHYNLLRHPSTSYYHHQFVTRKLQTFHPSLQSHKLFLSKLALRCYAACCFYELTRMSYSHRNLHMCHQYSSPSVYWKSPPIDLPSFSPLTTFKTALKERLILK